MLAGAKDDGSGIRIEQLRCHTYGKNMTAMEYALERRDRTAMTMIHHTLERRRKYQEEFPRALNESLFALSAEPALIASVMNYAAYVR